MKLASSLLYDSEDKQVASHMTVANVRTFNVKASAKLSVANHTVVRCEALKRTSGSVSFGAHKRVYCRLQISGQRTHKFVGTPFTPTSNIRPNRYVLLRLLNLQ